MPAGSGTMRDRCLRPPSFRWPCSTPASAASPSCTSCSSRCRPRTTLYLGDTARLPVRRPQPAGAQGVRDRDRRPPARVGREAARRRVQRGQLGGARRARGAISTRPAATIDVIGVVAPATQLAVAGSRSGRIGLLATPATVASGAYERAVARRRSARAPRERRLPGPRADHPGRLPLDEQVVDDRPRLLRAAARGRGRHRDPRLHPLPAGRADAAAGAGTGRHARDLGRRGGAQRRAGADRPRAAATRAAARGPTASAAPATSTRSARLGTRFLQMPLGEVTHVDLGARVAA